MHYEIRPRKTELHVLGNILSLNLCSINSISHTDLNRNMPENRSSFTAKKKDKDRREGKGHRCCLAEEINSILFCMHQLFSTRMIRKG